MKYKKSPLQKSRQNAIAQLRALETVPSKEKGQNFLVSSLVVSSIIEFGKPEQSEYLVEIGPGLGALTASLVPNGLKTVIEIEPSFAKDIAAKYPGIEVVNRDAREVDYSQFPGRVTIFSNLPYSISSEMILALLDIPALSIDRVVLMLQKEFAQRLAAPVGDSNYGILSVFCQMATETKLGPIISAEYFHPRPKIDSQLIEIKFKKDRALVEDPARLLSFKKLVRAAFSKRRKMLLNSLMSTGLYEKGALVKALEGANIPATVRAQELSYKDFLRLHSALF